MKTVINKGGALLIFIIGVGVGFGLYWFVQNSPLFSLLQERISSPEAIVEKSGDVENQEDKEHSEAPLLLVVEGEGVVVVNDQPAGNKVIISMISLDAGGWIAIHEGTKDSLGVILGARRFDEGKYFGETIELLRATERGTSYIAVLHTDDGDSDFDFKRELPLKDISGELIAEEFTTLPESN